MVRCWGESRGASKGEVTMPQNKDLKRLVRARMRKTGEAYTTARSQIVKKPKTKTATATRVSASGVPPADYASVAGMSDEKIKAKTGCTWERWVYALDRQGAENLQRSGLEVVRGMV
jgi:hypothetical protein